MNSPSGEKFFNPGVTVDIVVFTIEEDTLRVLLIKRADVPYKGAYALPGGFVHEGETSRDAALRVLATKAGVKDVYVEQLFTFDNLGRDPRGQIMSVTYFALVPREKIQVVDGPLTEQPSFLSVKNPPELAFDHKEILSYATKRLTDKILYTNIVYSLLPSEFTLTELQKTYETVLDRPIDKRNFRKKFLDLDLLKATKKKRTGLRQRPAVLYTFKGTAMKELEKFFKN